GSGNGLARRDRPRFNSLQLPVVTDRDGYVSFSAEHLRDSALLHAKAFGQISLRAVLSQVFNEGYGLHGVLSLESCTHISTAVIDFSSKTAAVLFA
ncbi:hypothetical protein, partial [Pseudomonas aeruginosa]|uniref:hypothetical protein n=1 Tax=Pseudomonas aeruginosa TaxID=287 RepID=UPI003C6E03EA